MSYDNEPDITIDYDTAARIAVCSLKDAFFYMKKSIEEDDSGKFKIHPEDYAYNIQMIRHLREVLSYYGEKV